MRNTTITILALASLLVLSCAAPAYRSGSGAPLQSKDSARECRARAYNKCQSLSPSERRECNIAAQNACTQENQGGGWVR